MINQYVPDYAVPPGEVLEEYLDSYGMTQAELANRLGFAKKTVNEIIKGKASITPDTSLKLERVFNRPAHFWNNLVQLYQEDSARLAEQERLHEHLDWLKRVPIISMIKLNFIQKFKDKVEQLNEVLRFFGVASPEQWRTVWEQHQVAYRQSQRFEPCAEAVSAWLRQGEIEAQRINCSVFDKNIFQKVLVDARGLTREKPEEFLPLITELCANAGVAVVFIPDLPKTGICGATRWLGSKAVIQLSLRYKSNDHLWFTFFHEAGHILKHGRKEIFLEGNGMADEKEKQADIFARNILIPLNDFNNFVTTSRLTLKEIVSFSDDIGIAPGIVIGRLQHENHLPQNHGNKLKVFYKWTASL